MTSEPSASHPAAPAADTPLGYLIQTDRPCARCGFNLFGQPVIRERHYGLVATRCPECGQLAALQEYPSLGRWADRWAKVIAALWIAALVGAMFVNFGPLMGLVMASLESASADLGDEIALRFAEWQAAQSGGGPTAPFGTGRWSMIESSWWAAHRDEIVAARAGPVQWINWGVVGIWIPMSIIGFCGGVFWSTCLLGARSRFAVVPALLPLLVAGLTGWAVYREEVAGGGILQASSAAVGHLQGVVLPVMIGVVGAWILLGVWLGRRVARLLVCWALPPRMRTALAVLWTRDGLPPPGGGGARG